MTATRQPMSLAQQADYIDAIARRCVCLDGATAKETFVSLTADDAEDLRALAQRLRRMAPHESAIRKMVVGR